MATIQIKNLTFGYGEKILFDNAFLTLESQWKLGLTGRNGRGKTTFFQILQSKLPYSGTVTHQLEFVYFPCTISEPSMLTYYALAQQQDFEFWQIKKEFQLLGMEEDLLWRPFDSLSGGEQTKALLALLFLDENHYPLIDEPTNHLDLATRNQVVSYLQQKKQGFILVSHDQHFMDQVIDHLLSIEKNQLVLYQGNYSTALAEKEKRDQFELQQNEKLKKEITRLKQTAAEKAQWSNSREQDKKHSSHSFVSSEERNQDKGAIGADAARAMKRSKAIVRRMDAQIETKAGLLKNIEYIDPLSINYQPSHRKKFFKAENLGLSFENQKLFSGLNFEISAGDRVAIIGNNGAGKSSLLKALLGCFTGAQTGQLTCATGLELSLVRQAYQDNQGLLEDFCQSQKIAYPELLNNLHKLGMERLTFQTPIEKMSMGQQKKVELAKSLGTAAELFIWDEPLNYLDLFNRQQLEEVLLEVKPSLIFVEHDPLFTKKIATKVIDLAQL